jgi:hypothetical protein
LEAVAGRGREKRIPANGADASDGAVRGTGKAPRRRRARPKLSPEEKRARAAAAMRMKRARQRAAREAADGKAKPDEPAPAVDTTILANEPERPFRSPLRPTRADPDMAERERHLALPQL